MILSLQRVMSVLKTVKELLTARFIIKDLGKRKHFLGIDFEQTEDYVKMSQERCVEKKGFKCKTVNQDQLFVNQSCSIMMILRK